MDLGCEPHFPEEFGNKAAGPGTRHPPSVSVNNSHPRANLPQAGVELECCTGLRETRNAFPSILSVRRNDEQMIPQ